VALVPATKSPVASPSGCASELPTDSSSHEFSPASVPTAAPVVELIPLKK